jgi:uncharacterized C2H2 Zn-finger protein
MPPVVALPAELHNKILFELLISSGHQFNLSVAAYRDVQPYILACPAARLCWRANKRLILHHVAKAHLAVAERQRKDLRRKAVLAKLRYLVWKGAHLPPPPGCVVHSTEMNAYSTLQIAISDLWLLRERVLGLRRYLLKN